MSHARSLMLLALAAACAESQDPVPGYVSSSGSLTLSRDDARVYVADADHRALFVLDAKQGTEVARIDLGAQPAEVLRGPGGAVYVSLRGGRSVARVEDTRIVAQGTTGAEPVGMALSPDAKRLYVANMSSRSLSVLDAGTLARIRPDIPIGQAPRAVAALPSGRVFVGDFLAGSVSEVDPESGEVPSTVEFIVPAVAECGGGDERSPSQVTAVALAPKGDRLYAVHVQSRLEPQRTRWGGDVSLAQAVAPAIATVELKSGRQLLDPRPFQDCFDECDPPDFPPPLLVTSCAPPPGMDAPSAMVVDPSGAWLFVADHNSNALAVVSATRLQEESFRFPERGLADVVPIGARPTGLALSGDQGAIYVHAAFDYTVAVVRAVDSGASRRLEVVQRFAYARSPLPAAVERGRRLFYSAVDERMTRAELGGVSCSSCHPEGRTDGLTWRLLQGRRNTPALWGVTQTAPYHWEGLVSSLPAFNARMVETMGGRGLSQEDAADLEAYLAAIPPPDAPLPTALAAEGRALFQGSVGCAGCHAGPLFTDGRTHAAENGLTIDTPSLVGARTTPPYLHDGTAPALGVVLSDSAALAEHRVAGKLSPAELKALIEYVESL